MKKVIIDNYPLNSGHAIRGMGMYTNNLIKYLSKLEQKKIKIEDKNLRKEKSYADLIHYPYFDLFADTLPEKKMAKKVVVTVPDVIPLLYPEKYPLGIRSRIKLNKNINLLNTHVDAVVTISETSKKDIVRLLNYDPSKIFVTYLAPNFKFSKVTKTKKDKVITKYNLPEKFVLYVGDVGVNKNVEMLAQACINTKTNLVIVGKQASELDEFNFNKTGPRDLFRKVIGKKHPEVKHFENLNQLFSNDLIHTLGFLPKEDLNAIWNQATIYCQPSLYEGFGLGTIEAMQAGVPVIASKTQAISEVASDKCLYFDPKSISDLESKTKLLFSDSKLQNKYKKEANEFVKKYDWKKTAEQTFEVYDSLLK